jgi:hypothetical protein
MKTKTAKSSPGATKSNSQFQPGAVPKRNRTKTGAGSLSAKFPGVPLHILKNYGLPAFLNANKQPTKLNEQFWSALYAHENVIVYEPDEREFFRYSSSSGLYLAQTVDTLRGLIAARIRQAVREWPNHVGLLKMISEQNLRGIIAFLRGHVEKKNAFKRTENFIHLANGVLLFKGDGTFTVDHFSPRFMSRSQSRMARS